MEHPCILIVDDEVGVIRTLRAGLEASGFETLAARDGCEALEVIRKCSPDILILDILMPRMDGFEVCRRVREWSKIPIIMLSALHDEKEKVKCLDLGSDDYVCKPFDLSELIARVRAVLRRATEAKIRKDIEEGTKDAAERAGVPPLSEGEMKYLFDLYSSPSRCVGVEVGNEVVLSSDGSAVRETFGPLGGGCGAAIDCGPQACAQA